MQMKKKLSPSRPTLILLCAVWIMLCASLYAQEAKSSNTAFSPPPVAQPDSAGIQPLATPNMADATATTITPRVKSILARLEAVSKDTKTIMVEFAETIVKARVGDKIQSEGTLLVKMPNTFRLTYSKPAKTVHLYTKSTWYQYEPELNQVNFAKNPNDDEAQKLGRMYMLGFGLASDELQQYYSIVEAKASPQIKGVLALTFTPIDPDIAQELTNITVSFDEKNMHPRNIYFQKTSGDKHFITLKKTEYNKSISEKEFDPDTFGSWIRKPKFNDNTKDIFPNATPAK